MANEREARNWLCVVNARGVPHVLFRLERALHSIDYRCRCKVRHVDGVVVHELLFRAMARQFARLTQ